MIKVCAKVYYLISTGEILVITSECQGSVEESTKEQDINIYPQLNGKASYEIECIELEYGTLSTIFKNAKEYKVNLETKKLEVTHFSQGELDAMQKESQENQLLNDRIDTIAQYLNSQGSQSIYDIEAYILESEKNKILN